MFAKIWTKVCFKLLQNRPNIFPKEDKNVLEMIAWLNLTRWSIFFWTILNLTFYTFKVPDGCEPAAGSWEDDLYPGAGGGRGQVPALLRKGVPGENKK